MGGTPVFTGTRVPVQNLFGYIPKVTTLMNFWNDYPTISKEAAIQVLEMAKKSLTTEKMLNEILLDENLPKQLKADFVLRNT